MFVNWKQLFACVVGALCLVSCQIMEQGGSTNSKQVRKIPTDNTSNSEQSPAGTGIGTEPVLGGICRVSRPGIGACPLEGNCLHGAACFCPDGQPGLTDCRK